MVRRFYLESEYKGAWLESREADSQIFNEGTCLMWGNKRRAVPCRLIGTKIQSPKGRGGAVGFCGATSQKVTL